jgi:hypothetical protein
MSERNSFAQGPYKVRTVGDNEDDKVAKMSVDENETTNMIQRQKATTK